MFKRFKIRDLRGFGLYNDGGEGDGGGSGGGGNGGEGGEKKPPAKAEPEKIDKAEFDRVMADLHKQKEKNKKYEQERETEKTNRLKEQNQWKELAEAKEKEANEAKEEADRIKNSFLGERKFNAVRLACEKLGLRAEAGDDLEMLDLAGIQIETTSTGKINVLGADKFAERLKTTKPHWFADKTPPNVNTDRARVIESGGAITVADLSAAEKEGRKSGNMSKYHELHKKFQQQRAGARRA